MWQSADSLPLTDEQKNQLESWVQAPSTPQKIVLRARICLLAHEGLPNRRIAEQLKTSRPTVILWRHHFLKGGVAGLEHEPARKISSQRTQDDQIKAIVEATLHTKPEDATHWSSRTLAERFGVSHMTVARIWDSHGLQPHRVRNFKLSRDKQFVEKLTDVVGLYLNPPDKALVLCVDEKSQIQALDRTQPGLPMKKGRCGTLTHDYVRHGTTTLFAALNVLDGTVIGSCFDRHRHEEFLKFLRQVDRDTPEGMDLHLIVDNYSTHKHECHHLSAVSFEQVLRQVKARYITGLTATPQRKDGHHPIIVMQCGAIRHRVDAKAQALARPFKHIVIPRPTNFRLSHTTEKPEMHELYAALAGNKARNDQICVDLLRVIKAGRSPILLTERTSQIDEFAGRLNGLVKHILVLKGGMGVKQRRGIAEQLAAIPNDDERVLLATGRYIGEGFDDARLDTLFLAMPISWRGTLQQYVGRLHRLYDSKRKVIVYDYVDGCVPVLSAMYSKRVRGYEAVGYKIQEEIDKGP